MVCNINPHSKSSCAITLKNMEIAVPANVIHTNPTGGTVDAQPNVHAIPRDPPSQRIPAPDPIKHYFGKLSNARRIVANGRRSRNRVCNHVAIKMVKRLNPSLYNRMPIGDVCFHLASVELSGIMKGANKTPHTIKNNIVLHNIFHIVESIEIILAFMNCYFNSTSFFTCLMFAPAVVFALSS